jgi:ABC-type glycerol-3-phosphate transport system substrate-binding protein
MSKKKISTLLMAVILVLALLALGGCGGGDANDPGFIYLPEYISLPDEVQNIEQSYYKDGVLYFSNYGKTGERTPNPGEPQPGDSEYYDGYYDIYGSTLNKINIDGSGYQQLTDYTPTAIPEGQEGSVSLSGIAVDQDGNLWISENCSFYHTDADGMWVDDGSTVFLRKLDATGAELASIDISSWGEENGYLYISTIVPGADGNLYLSDGNMTVYVIDSNGQELYNVSSDNWLSSLIALSDGSIAATLYGESGMVLKTIDGTAKTWGETIELPDQINQTFSGSGDYDFFYTDNSSFYGYKISSQTKDKLINWLNSEVDNYNMGRIFPLEDGRVLGIMYNYDETSGSSNQELVILTKHKSSEVEKKTTLTMAAIYLDSNVRSAVIKFNKTNPDYRIMVTDYSDYNTDEDYNAGLLKLNTEIISGQVPDILAVNSSMPVKQYAAKGVLEDLYPYIEQDEELGGSDSFVPSVFKAIQSGDMLPYIASNFSIISTIGDSRVVGTEPGWTIDELNAVLATMPEGCRPFAYYDQQTILYYLCAIGMDDYVDWDKGECHFDDPGFIKMLEFAKTFPATIDWDDPENMESEDQLIKEGKVLLMQAYLSDFSSLDYYKNTFGGDITFKGFPTESGDGNVLSVDSGLAISATCKHKDVAWDFISFLLTEDYQTDNTWWGYPTNQKVFDARLDQALHPEDGNDGGGVVPYDDMVKASPTDLPYTDYKFTQEDADKILAIINSVDKTMSYDQAIMDIINEEVAAFLAGSKSAADTAVIIQDRVGIYVSEQS